MRLERTLRHVAAALAAVTMVACSGNKDAPQPACVESAARGDWQSVSEARGYETTSTEPYVTVGGRGQGVVVYAIHPQAGTAGGDRPGVWTEDCLGGVKVERSTVWREGTALAAALTINVAGEDLYVSAVTEEREGDALDEALADWVEEWVIVGDVGAEKPAP